MQDLNNSLTTYLKRGLFGARMTSRQGIGAPNPNWIPVGNDVVRRVAERSAATLVAGTSTSSTARAPRAVALWPNKGEPDPRPPLGSTYQRISPVRPRKPIVPENASAALHLSAI
jgi:cholesterol oxidase